MNNHWNDVNDKEDLRDNDNNEDEDDRNKELYPTNSLTLRNVAIDIDPLHVILPQVVFHEAVRQSAATLVKTQ